MIRYVDAHIRTEQKIRDILEYRLLDIDDGERGIEANTLEPSKSGPTAEELVTL